MSEKPGAIVPPVPTSESQEITLRLDAVQTAKKLVEIDDSKVVRLDDDAE